MSVPVMPALSKAVPLQKFMALMVRAGQRFPAVVCQINLRSGKGSFAQPTQSSGSPAVLAVLTVAAPRAFPYIDQTHP